MADSWNTPSLIPFDKTGSLPDADFRSVYVPNVLLAKRAPAEVVSSFEVELLPALVGSEERFERRVRQVEKGEAELIPAEEVFARIRRRLG